jgi:hypothetical protein
MLFKHDCKKCSYIGTLDGKDVYGCDDIGGPTVVLRYGSRGEEYQAYPVWLLVDRLFRGDAAYRCKTCGSDYKPMCHCEAEEKLTNQTEGDQP